MTYNYDSEVEVDYPFDIQEIFRQVVDAALDIEKCPYECEVSLLVTDDDSIHEINREMRKVDRATDVLSFPMISWETPADFDSLSESDDIFNPETGELYLGDIVISADHVNAQAVEYGHSLLREFAFLVAHSMLHLMGYDHMEDDERVVMESHQRDIMDYLNIKR